MNNKSQRLEALFHVTKDLSTPDQRDIYLRDACKDDPELAAQVTALLHASEQAEAIFTATKQNADPRTEMPKPLSESPGTVIGRYTLLQMIGDGGFGVVYMAEQKEPVRRRVALKIIKLGMDTQQVVARFEAERQALAMMDHPNIARVFDGGATETPLPAPGYPLHEPTPAPLPGGELATGRCNEASLLRGAGGEGAVPLTPDSRLLTSGSGRPYFVMELVKGQTVTKYCDEHQLSTRQRLELFIPICQAIQHAHQKGIIHRDIKPSNILVATIDGRPVPKVIDFGIAKATQHDLTDKIVFTQFHQFMGTPAYMSPEQAAMDSTDIDTRSDIYSLGVLLYELLTGKTPVEAKELTRGGFDEIRRRIREIEPPRPSNRLTTLTNDELTTVARSRAIEPARLAKLIRGELDWVVLKAMDKDRSRRYETASAFALDIQRYLDNEPVTAVKPSPIYHLQKFARRHKVALATAACFVLLLAVSACVATAQAITNKSLFTAAEEARLKEMNGKERETELRRIAETERDRSKRLLYTIGMNLATRAWDEANIGRVVELLDVQRPQPGQPDLRSFEWFYLERLCHRDLFTLKGGSNGVSRVTYSADGKRLATASPDGTVKVWDATTGQEMLTLTGHTNHIFGLAFTPDGKRLASTSADPDPRKGNKWGQVKIWDALNGQEELPLKGLNGGYYRLAFNQDGKLLALADVDNTVKVLDSHSGANTLTLKGHTGFISSVAFSPDGKRLATSSYDKTTRIWDAITGQEVICFKGHTGPLYSTAFSPDGKQLASAGGDYPKPGELKVWDATTGREMLTLKGHTKAVTGVAFSADGKRLASTSHDQTVKVWDATSGRETLTLRGHIGSVYNVAFSPDGRRLASAGNDRTAKVWDVSSDPEPLTLKGHVGRVVSVAFSPDGKRLVSAGLDRTVRLWDANSGMEMLTFKGHTDGVNSLALSPDGRRLASASVDKTLKVWDTTTGQEIMTLKGHGGPVENVVFSPDGKQLASASYDQMIKLWDATTGQETLTLKGHNYQVSGVAFSPDGKRLASSSGDIYSADKLGEIKVWDVTSGQELLTFKGHTNGINRVAFSPDGKRLASAAFDKTLKVWDAITGEEILTLEGHTGGVRGLAFSPDGKRLASSSDDGTVKLWDAMTGQEMLTLKGHAGGVKAVAFSPDGKRLASAGGEYDRSKPGELKLWDAQPRSPANIPDAKTR